MPGGGRPVMIHLRFTNRGTTTVGLQIADFLSPLGNFVVRPEKLTLEPGQSLETEPMTADDPLWAVPGITITPHIAGQSSPQVVAAQFIAGLQALRSGAPLPNVVDRSRGY